MSAAVDPMIPPPPRAAYGGRGSGTTIMYDGLVTLGYRLANFVFAVLLGVLSARVLGPHGRGVYAIPMIDAAIASAFYPGLASAASYFLLKRDAGRRIVAPAIISSAAFVAIGSGIVLALALIGRHLWAAPAAMASLPFTAGIMVAAGYVTGTKRVRYSAVLTLAVTIATLVLMAVCFLVVARSPAVAIGAWVGGSAVVSIVAIALLIVDARQRSASSQLGALEFLRYALRTGLVSFVGLVNYRADMYIVALLAPTSQLGLYAVAVAGAESLLVVAQSAATVVSPHVGSSDRAAAAELSARCVRNVVLLALVACGALAVAAPLAVRILWGAAFMGLVPALRVLLIGTFALSMTSPISSYFTINRGKPEVPLTVAGISAAICIALTLALVPKLGIIGAAIGSSAAYVAGQWATVALFTRDAKIPVKHVLVPTKRDLADYLSFGRRVLADSRNLARGEAIS